MKLKYYKVKNLLSIIGLVVSASCFCQNNMKSFSWPNNEKLAVSLSYDDALDSQLDNAIHHLNEYHIKASFYIVPSSKTVFDRLQEWRDIALQGHELGNHSVYHPCRASLPGREWVKSHKDLDHYTLAQIKEELITANTILHAIDGKIERTFTPPCLDSLIAGKNYIPKIANMFIAIKGQGIEDGFSHLWAPSAVTGKDLIKYIEESNRKYKMVNIIFHGIGGDYLSVSNNAHKELLQFLSNNKEDYRVDTFMNLMKYTEAITHQNKSK